MPNYGDTPARFPHFRTAGPHRCLFPRPFPPLIRSKIDEDRVPRARRSSVAAASAYRNARNVDTGNVCVRVCVRVCVLRRIHLDLFKMRPFSEGFPDPEPSSS